MNIQQTVRSYVQSWIELGQWKQPNLTDCLDFMACEVTEAIDKRLRQSPYYRNNEEPLPGGCEIGEEIFDAIMMGCIALDLLGLDLDVIATAKLCKMDSKKRMK